MVFRDRNQAGELLAKKLKPKLSKMDNLVVYSLVRGGVVVGYEIAKKLHVPLEVILVRKIGYPGNPEYAIGAVAESDAPIMNEHEAESVGTEYIKKTIARERETIARRSSLYVGSSGRIGASGKTAIIVDDGIATGLTMKAAIVYIRRQNPKRIIMAVPVASREAMQDITPLVDDTVTLIPAERFSGAIGAHYIKFDQVEDIAVITMLEAARDLYGATVEGDSPDCDQEFRTPKS